MNVYNNTIEYFHQIFTKRGPDLDPPSTDYFPKRTKNPEIRKTNKRETQERNPKSKN